MPVGSVVGVYDRMSGPEEAIRRLSQSGFPIVQISIVARDLESEKEVHGYLTAGDVDKNGTTAGAWFGGLFGLLVGAAFLWVPGFGPLLVIGPLAAAMLSGIEGSLAGATSGGLLGALVGWGVSRQQVLKYEELVKSRKHLVIAHGSAEEVTQAHDILKGTAAEELAIHS